MCPLAIYMSSLENWLFRSSAQYLIQSFGALILNSMSCLNIFEINPCQSHCLKYFLPFYVFA